MRYTFSHQSAKSNISYFTDRTKNTHRRALLFYWIFTQRKLSSIYRHEPIVTYWALMKRHALLTIWAKLKLAIQLYFRSKSKTLVRSSQACGKRRKTLKPWNAAISQHIQLVFFVCYRAAHTKIRHCLHSNYSNLRRKHLSKFPTAINLRCWVLGRKPFSSPEPTILLACGRNRELWQQPFWNNKGNNRILPIRFHAVYIYGACLKWLLPELSIPAVGQKDRRLWGREWPKA